jgi:hypothetical protein
MKTYDPMPSYLKINKDGSYAAYVRNFDAGYGRWIKTDGVEAWSPSRWNPWTLLKAWTTCKQIRRDRSWQIAREREIARMKKVYVGASSDRWKSLCGRKGNVIFRWRAD